MQIHVVIKIFPWFETFLKPQKMYIQTTKYIVHDLYKGGGGGLIRGKTSQKFLIL